MNRKADAAALAAALILVVIVALAPEIPRELPGPRIEGQVQNFIITNAALPAPPMTWTDADGANISLADFRGKVVMVNFWATWCAPCLRELPSINELQAKLAGDDFTVVAINIDKEGKQVAEPFATRLGLDRLDLYLDPALVVARAMGVQVMPTTIVYDREGREIGRLMGGAEWNSPEAIALLRFIIENPDEDADSPDV